MKLDQEGDNKDEEKFSKIIDRRKSESEILMKVATPSKKYQPIL